MIRSRIAFLAAIPLLLALAACELGSKRVTQTGARGQGLEQVTDPDNVRKAAAIPALSFQLSPNAASGPRVQGQNIQVLGDLSQEQFTHLMSSMSLWVGGNESNCGFCHNPANYADDSNYRFRVARQMLTMTRALNSQWSQHTGQTGVTCFTCHRGNAVPEYYWTSQPVTDRFAVRGQRRGQNQPDRNVGYSSLPVGVFDSYFAGNPQAVRVASDSAYPGTNPAGTRSAEDSYAIMMHLSQALGVNCTYCHNSQSFRAWNLSSAQRATAWYGIRMVRDINQVHIEPMRDWFPAERRGPTGDPFKVNCLTCHQGLARPLGGQSMLANYPYLRAPGRAAAAPAVPPAAITDAMRNPQGMTDNAGPPNAPPAEEDEEPTQ